MLGLVGCQPNASGGSNGNIVSHTEQFDVPSTWTKVSTADYSFFVPPTVERASKDDLFRTFSGNADIDLDNLIMFQQKGLGKASYDEIDKHYCRIIARVQKGHKDDYPLRDDAFPIDEEIRSILRQRVELELCGSALVSGPTYRWLDVNGTKVLETQYVRRGNNGNTTNCRIYFLFDNNRMVDVIVSYREQEESLWIPDLTNVIKTFRWK